MLEPVDEKTVYQEVVNVPIGKPLGAFHESSGPCLSANTSSRLRSLVQATRSLGAIDKSKRVQNFIPLQNPNKSAISFRPRDSVLAFAPVFNWEEPPCHSFDRSAAVR